MTEITQADRDATALWAKHNGRHQQAANIRRGTADSTYLPKLFAHHRQYGYDQGYYDGRQADGAEERAKIVAWLRGNDMNGRWSALADAIEAGEHLK